MSSSVNTGSTQLICHQCSKSDYIASTDFFGKNSTGYFSCKKFSATSPKDLLSELLRSKFSIQCLRPGLKHEEANHKCYKEYAYSDPTHVGQPKTIHDLLCETHKNNQTNTTLLEKFKEKVIMKQSKNCADFTKNISLLCVIEAFYSTLLGKGLINIIPDVQYRVIFVLQTLTVDEVTLHLFLDTGCGDIVVKKSAMETLKKVSRARKELAGPISMSGVGDHKSLTKYGVYNLCLPCLKGNLFQACFDSQFLSQDGMTGIVYGQHEKRSLIEENNRKSNPNLSAKSYLSSSVIEYRKLYNASTGKTALGNISDTKDLLCGSDQGFS